jgi:hypothetical protein
MGQRPGSGRDLGAADSGRLPVYRAKSAAVTAPIFAALAQSRCGGVAAGAPGPGPGSVRL